MTDHPITPPPELVEQWASEFYGTTIAPGEAAIDIANQAARWGSDQELEACCQEVQDWYGNGSRLRAIRRPKPPSLRAQALDALSLMLMFIPPGDQREQGETIRRALETLND